MKPRPKKTDAEPTAKNEPSEKPALEQDLQPENLSESQTVSEVVTADEEVTVPGLPGELRTPTGQIVVRMGGAPEHGDPHYRLLIEGRQVASGNVDWSMGLPALNEPNAENFMCWQEVAIEWGFEDGLPSNVSLTYEPDHAGQNSTTCLLAVDWIDVDGLRIPVSSDYVHVHGKRIPWPGEDAIWSWTGEITFDIDAAFRGDEADPNDLPPRSEKADAKAPPLIIHASDEDLANPSVMIELAALRSHMRAEDNPVLDADRLSEYAHLGLKAGPWGDVKVLDSAGNEISLNNDGTFHYENPVSPQTEPGPETPAVSAENATEIKNAFLQDRVMQAMEMVNLVQSASDLETVPSGLPGNSSSVPGQGETPIISRREAQRNIKDFYSHVLKRTLDKLQEAVPDDGVWEGSSLSDTSSVGSVGPISKDHNHLSRGYGENLKSEFVQAVLAKAYRHPKSGPAY